MNISLNTKIILLPILFCCFENLAFAHNLPVSSDFGWREHPITHERRFHTGVDIAYNIGTPITAIKAGKVVYAAPWGWYGNCIILEHPDGDKTLYAHCKHLIAHYQEEVAKGDTIAIVGATGRVTGPHLHLEWWHNGVYFDPLKLLS